MSFKKAIEAQAHKGKTFTENGAVVRKSSGTDVLNLFTKIGSMRNTPDSEKARMFHKAYHENADLTVRMLLWVRDVLQGAGERQTFRVLLKELENLDKDLAKRLIPKIPELGRWDDLFAYDTPSIQKEAMEFYYKALKNKNSLAAKWAPREASARKEWAERLRAVTGLTPKQYRKMLVELTDVVETKMCDNKWKEINFSHVPSVAMSIYNRAFMKHVPKEFSEFSEKAVNGEVKINAKALYPHILYQKMKEYGNNKDTIQAQWNSLPDFVSNGARILPMCDVSGSMRGLPMDVSIGLGLYLAERNKSVFKDVVLTFSSNPMLYSLQGDLYSKIRQLETADWAMSTNLEKAFDLVLSTGIKNKLSENDMPEMIVVLTDMQFDQGSSTNETTLKAIKKKYKAAGYKMPKLVFWNLDSRWNTDQVQAKFDKEMVAEVSGFSPSIMTAILSDKLEKFTPYNVMLETLQKERYNY